MIPKKVLQICLSDQTIQLASPQNMREKALSPWLFRFHCPGWVNPGIDGATIFKRRFFLRSQYPSVLSRKIPWWSGFIVYCTNLKECPVAVARLLIGELTLIGFPTNCWLSNRIHDGDVCSNINNQNGPSKWCFWDLIPGIHRQGSTASNRLLHQLRLVVNIWAGRILEEWCALRHRYVAVIGSNMKRTLKNIQYPLTSTWLVRRTKETSSSSHSRKVASSPYHQTRGTQSGHLTNMLIWLRESSFRG